MFSFSFTVTLITQNSVPIFVGFYPSVLLIEKGACFECLKLFSGFRNKEPVDRTKDTEGGGSGRIPPLMAPRGPRSATAQQRREERGEHRRPAHNRVACQRRDERSDSLERCRSPAERNNAGAGFQNRAQPQADADFTELPESAELLLGLRRQMGWAPVARGHSPLAGGWAASSSPFLPSHSGLMVVRKHTLLSSKYTFLLVSLCSA